MVAEWQEDQGKHGAGLLLPGVWSEAVDSVQCLALHRRVMDLCMLLMQRLRLGHAQPAGLVLLDKQTWQLCMELTASWLLDSLAACS